MARIITPALMDVRGTESEAQEFVGSSSGITVPAISNFGHALCSVEIKFNLELRMFPYKSPWVKKIGLLLARPHAKRPDRHVLT